MKITPRGIWLVEHPYWYDKMMTDEGKLRWWARVYFKIKENYKDVLLWFLFMNMIPVVCVGIIFFHAFVGGYSPSIVPTWVYILYYCIGWIVNLGVILLSR